MKTAKDRKIEKLEELVKHVGLQEGVPFLKALRNTKCPKCIKYADELEVLDKEIEQGDEKARCSNCDVPEALIRAASTMLRRRINR